MRKFFLSITIALLFLSSGSSALAQDDSLAKKPIIAAEIVTLEWWQLLLIYFLLIIACACAAGWYYVARKRTQEAYKIIAGQDLEKLIALLTQDLKTVEDVLQGEKHEASAAAALDFRFRKMQDNLTKMSKYLGQELKDIGANE